MTVRVLVLGGGGFIGRRIVAALAPRPGVEVIAAGRSPPSAMPAGVDRRAVDVTDAASLEAAMRGVSHVIGSVMGSVAAIDAAGTGVARAAARAGVARMVHLSSIAVLPDRGVVGEDADFAPPADGYAAAKQRAERAVRDIMGAAGVILRPGLVHGAGSALWTARIGRLVRQGRLGDLGPAGKGGCPLVHVDDVADAAVVAALAVDAPSHPVHLVAAPMPSWNDYLAAMASALSVPLRPVGPRRLAMERAAAYPLQAWRPVAERLGLPVPAAITPGLARLFARDVVYRSSAVPLLLPRWRTMAAGVAAGTAWMTGGSA